MIKLSQAITLIELAKSLGVELKFGAHRAQENVSKEFDSNLNLATQLIQAIAPIETATVGQITFLANTLYAKYLNTTKASAIIISPKDQNLVKQPKLGLLLTEHPRLMLAKLLSLAVTPESAGVHPNCTLGKNVTLGKDVILEAGVVVGDNCEIGDHTVIKANSVLYPGVKIGKSCVIHSNTVIGSDGFGYVQNQAGAWVKLPHLGTVVIEDQVEIGSNTSVDRGCVGDTWIKRGVIIDNLVQIAHNVEIGEYTAIAGCVGIAGSTVIGRNCLIGGAVSIAGHLKITDRVSITATSSISRSILRAGTYSSGFPAKDHLVWKKKCGKV